MKYLLDAHLPLSLFYWMTQQNIDVIHPRDLPNGTASKDQEMNDFSIKESRIIITKDTDFYHSYIIKNQPYKLLLIRTGNLKKAVLLELIKKHFLVFDNLFLNNNMIELSTKGVKIMY